MTDAAAAIARAEATWGAHPMNWLRPPAVLPLWYQWLRKRHLAAVEAVFGPLSEDALVAYWTEAFKGQSVYEDAGGAMLRCYLAMLGEPVEEPYTYPQAVHDLTNPPSSDQPEQREGR